MADFATFGEALDYAAKGKRGLNFHDPRGNLLRPYPFSELRRDALDAARRLIARGVKRATAWRWWPKPAPISPRCSAGDLCGRLAGAAAAAHQLWRQGQLYRPACGAACQQRSQPVLLPPEIAHLGRLRPMPTTNGRAKG
jgi:hypothetical protein